MLNIYKNKNIFILGLGISGIEAANKLFSLGANISVFNDDKEKHDFPTLNPQINYCHYKEVNWQEIDYLMLSPGIPTNFPKPHPIIAYAKKYKVEITIDIELFLALIPKANIIAITGTNGKSTTTSLITHILKFAGKKTHMGGNIGVAVFALDIKNNADDYYILELSSYQLELINKAKFDVSILLNISPDHLDRHGNMENYIKVKEKIFTGGFEIRGDSLKEISNIDNMAKFGNGQNLAAAYEVAKFYNISNEIIVESLESYRSLAHRLELLGKINNINIYNDSKATNAESTINALKQLDNICLIAGGVAKEGGLVKILPYLDKIKRIYLIGESKGLFLQQLSQENYEAVEICGSLDKAFDDALEFSKKENIDNLLFSPACASFDMWDNFIARGEYFRKLFNGKII